MKPATAHSSFEENKTENDDRFAFGKNWQNFLSLLNEERIQQAEKSLREFLGLDSLEGQRMIDIGSGSGLFSLAARRMGAHVFSFDYDRDSVACTQTLKDRYFPNDSQWHVEQGSVLDDEYMTKRGTFDIVYSWGVLHHTGNMKKALTLAAERVKPGGLLYISIYNDQAYISDAYKFIKKTYVKSPPFIKKIMLAVYWLYCVTKGAAKDIVYRKNPMDRYRNKINERGMSLWYDLVDWLGGYPFEVARPDEIFDFYREKGFELLRMRTMAIGNGCNEYVFRRK
ncbi:MAG: class I SAM-dependent methyltransferase [Alphaproteobacteria bacterium]|nr:class I SAM-dependent methyltransferase [Alphaproteobacteria bacterium]